MSVLMNEMTWKEFESKKDNVVILPIGSTEQHGPHLPLSTDSIIAEEIAKIFATHINGVVAPTISYGYKSKPLSGGGPLFPGTIDLNATTLINIVYDILEELIRDGVTKIFVLNAHFENEAFILESIDLISNKYPSISIIETNWWDVLEQETIDTIFSEVAFPGWAFEHAAITETSLIMYLAPQLVHEELMLDEKGATPSPYCKYPIVTGMVPETGVLATAKSSSASKGKLIVDCAIKSFTDIINLEF